MFAMMKRLLGMTRNYICNAKKTAVYDQEVHACVYAQDFHRN